MKELHLFDILYIVHLYIFVLSFSVFENLYLYLLIYNIIICSFLYLFRLFQFLIFLKAANIACFILLEFFKKYM